mgnify:CR=1 FL=1
MIDNNSKDLLQQGVLTLNKLYDIDTGFLTIKATGTYQGLNRQLQAKIERNSGALLNIFDFTLYSRGDIE